MARCPRAVTPPQSLDKYICVVSRHRKVSLCSCWVSELNNYRCAMGKNCDRFRYEAGFKACSVDCLPNIRTWIGLVVLNPSCIKKLITIPVHSTTSPQALVTGDFPVQPWNFRLVNFGNIAFNSGKRCFFDVFHGDKFRFSPFCEQSCIPKWHCECHVVAGWKFTRWTFQGSRTLVKMWSNHFKVQVLWMHLPQQETVGVYKEMYYCKC